MPVTGQRILLGGIDWQTYKRLTRMFPEHSGVRMTYDRGMLEIMTKSHLHERANYLLSRLVEALADELAIDMVGCGGPTFFRPRTRGVEPDECYYIANAARVHGKTKIDLRTDPPPDLILETDITSSSIDRMAIYAVMGVPEVWQNEETGLTFHLLQANRTYQLSPTSGAFPWLASADLFPFLALGAQLYDREIVARFRAWVRQQAGGGTSAAGPTP
jgi:Uma2 family endonuclease